MLTMLHERRPESGVKQKINPEYPPFVFVRLDNRWKRVLVSEIIYLETQMNYTVVVTKDETMKILVTMKVFKASLPPDQFIQVHRSFVVNLAEVTSFSILRVWVGEKAIPIGEKYKGVLLKVVHLVGWPRDKNEPGKP